MRAYFNEQTLPIVVFIDARLATTRGKLNVPAVDEGSDTLLAEMVHKWFFRNDACVSLGTIS
jgi:hypothetical protein